MIEMGYKLLRLSRPLNDVLSRIRLGHILQKRQGELHGPPGIRKILAPARRLISIPSLPGAQWPSATQTERCGCGWCAQCANLCVSLQRYLVYFKRKKKTFLNGMRGDRAAASPSSATQVRGLTAPGWDECMIDLEPAPFCVSGNKRRRRVRRERVLQQVSSRIPWVSSSQLAAEEQKKARGFSRRRIGGFIFLFADCRLGGTTDVDCCLLACLLAC